MLADLHAGLRAAIGAQEEDAGVVAARGEHHALRYAEAHLARRQVRDEDDEPIRRARRLIRAADPENTVRSSPPTSSLSCSSLSAPSTYDASMTRATRSSVFWNSARSMSPLSCGASPLPAVRGGRCSPRCRLRQDASTVVSCSTRVSSASNVAIRRAEQRFGGVAPTRARRPPAKLLGALRQRRHDRLQIHDQRAEQIQAQRAHGDDLGRGGRILRE